MTDSRSIFGIIGYPVTYSLSPLIHNTGFKELGIDAEYQLFPLKENELDQFFKQLRDPSSAIQGLNVTVPYKETVLKYLDSFQPFAKKVNAINTIVINEDRTLHGFNTDGPGFLTHLTLEGFDSTNKRIAILGAGGAARAIITVLCLLPERPESIKLYDIDTNKAEVLVNDLKERVDASIVETVFSIDDLNIEIADLLINATPIGMKEGDPSLIEEELIHPKLMVYDLIYTKETPLVKLAKKNGAKAVSGLGMLFYQGVLAFQHWTNLQLEDDVKMKMQEALEQGINKT